MWIEFLINATCAIIALYLPGFILAFFGRLSRFSCFAIAPLFSSIAYYLLAFLYGKLGVVCSWQTIFLPIFIFVFLVTITRFYWTKRKETTVNKSIEKCDISLSTVALYLGIAIAIGCFYFIRTLDGAGSIYQENDNIYHLSLVRNFVDSSNYSMSSLFEYPASWHVIVAMVASFTNPELISVSVNAVNFILLSVVFPISILLFLSKVFNGNKRLLNFGAFCSLAFTAFPWGFLIFGPLYPNLFSYVMLPAVMALFILMVEAKEFKHRVAFFMLFCIAAASLIFAHPNAIFVGIVILVPYCVSRILKIENISYCKKICLSIFFTILVLIIWALLYISPLFNGVVSFDWPAYTSKYQAFVNILLLSLNKASVAQVVLATFVLLGIVYCLLRKKYVWIVFSYSILAIMLLINISTDGFAKHFLTGFWYSDEFRVASALALTGIPLAVIGLSALCGFSLSLIKLVSSREATQYECRVVVAVVAILFIVGNYSPSFSMPHEDVTIETGFGKVDSILSSGNSLENNVAALDQNELSFIEQVKEITGNDAVFNFPYDGSAYAYALMDLNIVNRGWFGYLDANTNPDGNLLRGDIDEIAENDGVYDAAMRQGIRYVLLLDQRENDGEGLYDAACDYDMWQGIISINDSTPGFDVVLAKDDMRLYRIAGI